jgi:hypothetical protein
MGGLALMGLSFFDQHFWEIVKNYLMNMFVDFFCNSSFGRPKGKIMLVVLKSLGPLACLIALSKFPPKCLLIDLLLLWAL